MTVALHLENLYWEVGSAAFLNSFFSTISYHLEPGGPGSRYPALRQLYNGSLSSALAVDAHGELQEVRRELSRFPPDQVVWDLDEPTAKPPWGSNISSDISDLSNYFVTSDGRDLFEVIFEALSEARESDQDLQIA